MKNIPILLGIIILFLITFLYLQVKPAFALMMLTSPDGSTCVIENPVNDRCDPDPNTCYSNPSTPMWCEGHKLGSLIPCGASTACGPTNRLSCGTQEGGGGVDSGGYCASRGYNVVSCEGGSYCGIDLSGIGCLSCGDPPEGPRVLCDCNSSDQANVCSGLPYTQTGADCDSRTCYGTKQPDCSGSGNKCSGSTYSTNCGGTCTGTKTCSGGQFCNTSTDTCQTTCTDPTCSDNGNYCSGANYTKTKCNGSTLTCTGTKTCTGNCAKPTNPNPPAGCTGGLCCAVCGDGIPDSYNGENIGNCPADYGGGGGSGGCIPNGVSCAGKSDSDCCGKDCWAGGGYICRDATGGNPQPGCSGNGGSCDSWNEQRCCSGYRCNAIGDQQTWGTCVSECNPSCPSSSSVACGQSISDGCGGDCGGQRGTYCSGGSKCISDTCVPPPNPPQPLCHDSGSGVANDMCNGDTATSILRTNISAQNVGPANSRLPHYHRFSLYNSSGQIVTSTGWNYLNNQWEIYTQKVSDMTELQEGVYYYWDSQSYSSSTGLQSSASSRWSFRYVPIKPFIETKEGSVHSNEGIDLPGGPRP